MDLPLKLPARSNILTRITVEQVLYGLAVLLAAVIRLSRLANIPLSPAEATQALSVYQFWRPEAVAVVSGSPAYFNLTSLLTQFLGFSDPVMRLVPAFFGIALAVLPWFLRHRLGSIGALVSSYLLVFSPVLSLLSRTVGGESIAVFSGLLLFIAWLRYQESGHARWFITAVIALALGLCSSPIFYSSIVSMLAAWLVIKVVGPPLFTDEEEEPLPMVRPSQELLRRSLLIGGAVFAAAATLFLWNLPGLNGVAKGLGDWLSLFLASSTLNTWLGPVLALGRYETMLIFIAGPGIIWAVWHGRPFPTLLVYWLTSSLLLLLIQRGYMDNLAVLALPGYLIAGRFVNDLTQKKASWYRWPLAGIVILFGLLSYFNLVRYSRVAGSTNSLVVPSYHLFLLVAGLLVVLIAVFFVWNRSESDAWQGIMMGLVAVLLFFTWGTTWNLTQFYANDTRERLITDASDDELPMLVETIREVSRQTKRGEDDLDILMTIDSPSLQWYLRDFNNLVVDAALPRTVNNEALITSMESAPTLETGYVGADLGYHRPNTEQILSLPSALGWWFFHQSAVSVNEERAVFWLRADLAGEAFTK
ncbi:MAG: glycosyltransferase family 39 protein [Candidatus Promineifilaceae bacterium]